MAYNGWTNYETWNVKLWMDNDEGSSRYWDRMAREDAGSHTKEDATHYLTKEIESHHREFMPEVTGVYADLLGSALDKVNWYEIAEGMIEDVWDDENPPIDDEEEGEKAV